MGCTWSCHMSLTLDLHVTYQLHPSLLQHPRYELFFIPSHCRYKLIPLVLTWPSISTSFFWSRSPMLCIWAAKQAVCFDPWLTRKNYLQTNTFPNLVVVEQKDCPYALWRKATGKGATSKLVRRRLARRGQVWFLGYQHQLLPGRLGSRVTSQCLAMSSSNNSRVEGLNVTLDDPASLHGRVLMNGWIWVRDSSEGKLRLGPLVL